MPPRWLEPLYKLATLFKVYGSLTSQKNGRGWEKKEVSTTEQRMISERNKKVSHLGLTCLVQINKEISFVKVMEWGDLVYWEEERGWKDKVS